MTSELEELIKKKEELKLQISLTEKKLKDVIASSKMKYTTKMLTDEQFIEFYYCNNEPVIVNIKLKD